MPQKLASADDVRGGEGELNESTESICADRRVQRAMHLASTDLTTRPTVAQISRAVGLSTTHFSRRFRLITGMSFPDWSTHVRIKHAKELLRTMDLSVTAVAASVGYTDVTTFSRVFRRHEFMCPRDYRLTLLRVRKVAVRTVRG